LRKNDFEVDLLVDELPCIAIFKGKNKFMEIPYDPSDRSLGFFLDRLQSGDAESIVFGEEGPDSEDL